MDQLPRLGKRELICLLSFTCNYVVFVWRGFLFLLVLGMGYVILLWHSLSLPYNYFSNSVYMQAWSKFTKWFRNKSVGKSVFTVLFGQWPWKLAQCHRNRINFLLQNNDTINKVWTKSIILVRRHYKGKLIWSKFDILMCYCDLENKVKVTKILSTIFPLPTMCLCKFSQNPPSGSEVTVWERLLFSLYKMVTLRIRSPSPKSNKLFIVSQ